MHPGLALLLLAVLLVHSLPSRAAKNSSKGAIRVSAQVLASCVMEEQGTDGRRMRCVKGVVYKEQVEVKQVKVGGRVEVFKVWAVEF